MKTVGEMEEILRSRGLLKAATGRGMSEKEQVRWLTCDSRDAKQGTLFICKGAAFKKEYLKQAVQQGCIAYVGEQIVETEPEITGLIVNDIRKAMAVLSAVFFHYQPGRPVLTGITGTKGKTTTAWYLKAMLDAWKKEQGQEETGLISTVENYDGKHREDAVMTTPEAPVLHEFLANAVDSGMEYVTMEVSSQALKYKRVKELQFQVGIFLNISEDHISPQEHEDFEDYFSSKLSLFRQTRVACVNLEAEHSERILKAARKAERIVTFGRRPEADLQCSQIRMNEEGISFQVICDRFTEWFSLGMKGSFNVENAMAAIAAAYVYGVPVSCMKQALRKTRVPGRMENFLSKDGKICGIVDFAHNRLSFEKLFDAVYQEYSGYKNIITVFGCPGGKALNRRRELGLIAGLFSDYVYITSDDPGMECPEKIGREIRSYVEMTGCPCSFIDERQEAVSRAMNLAADSPEKTLLLVLGRGSEKYQNIGGKSLRYPTDSCLIRRAMEKYDLSMSCRGASAAQ